MIDKNNIYKNLCRLVSIPGVSGTDKENLTAVEILNILKELKYFKEHPDYLKFLSIKNDPLNRHVVSAFVKAKKETQKTVIITGHYDVVDVEEYGPLKSIAYDIEKISKRINELPLDEDCLKDFESEDWLFGRGTADMKFGIALCIEMVKYFSESNELEGNLLFIAVPGEETNSEGMLSAVVYLSELQEKYSLDFTALLLAECYMTENKSENKVHNIHVGASGKVMPLFFFTGSETHADEPFEGFDPSFLFTQFHSLFYLNHDFCDTNKGETTPPPIELKSGDLKNLYSVSIPLYYAAYYNLVTLSLNPEELIDKLKKISMEAFENAIELYNKKISNYEKLVGRKIKSLKIEPYVTTFHDLYNETKTMYDGDLDKYINNFIKHLQQEHIEIQEICVRVVKEVYSKYPKKKPMIIIGFIPPYYPDVYPDINDDNVSHLLNTMKYVIGYAKEKYNQNLQIKNYYMGISDMSYTGLNKDQNFDELCENLIGINQLYFFPKDELEKINIPAVVLGGYGKDFHKSTERLNYSYNFEVLPDLYKTAIIQLLKN